MARIMSNRQKTITATSLSLTFIMLCSFYYCIDKYITGVPFFILTLIVPLLGIIILTNIIRGVVDLIKNRKLFSLARCLPLLIYIIVPLLPFPNAEQFQSKVVLRGCYEGTQNQAHILFRQDHSFEIHATGIFFYTKWYTGSWQKKRDTLFLNYNKNEVSKLLGKIVIIRNGYFETVASSNISKYPVSQFYVGSCKGEN